MVSLKSKLLLASAVVTFIVMTGCSKNVFVPERVSKTVSLEETYDKPIFIQHKKGITYKDGSVLNHQGVVKKLSLPKKFAYINQNSSSYIAADLSGNVLIIDKKSNEKRKIVLKTRILSAALHGKLLVCVDTKNTIKVYDIVDKKLLYLFEGKEVIAADMRLANPYFRNNLVFVPTLDGKIEFYSMQSNTIVRELSVSTEENFNNILFFHIDEASNRLYIATASKLYLFGSKKKEVELLIRNVIFEKNSVLVFTKDGFIKRYDDNLVLSGSLKIKFAHFLGALNRDSILVAEKEGYILDIKKDLSSYFVYKLDFDEGNFFVSDKSFFFANGIYTP